MSTPDRNLVRTIFMQIVELPRHERSEAIDRLCQGSEALRKEVESLLIADGSAAAGEFMTNPTAAHHPSTASAPITKGPGSRIGNYKILQLIGEGGFGSVFLTEQTKPVRRRVAMKIIKLGMDTRQVIARFEAERQALALMDHPSIAKVHDAGSTDSGRPYFVMEYVVGDPITRFADAHTLSVHERLELFRQVCSAVQHAHSKGVIHRDIKPGNVLVSMVDGKPLAKMIDFGIAKATAQPLTEKTLFTEHRQLIGTPEYMSSEQAEGSPDIDTRTDVYSLGVLLYELLTGATPIDGERLRSAAWDEMRRIIKDEDPPAPSLRLSRELSTLAEVAAMRQSDAAHLGTSVRGELDWIVMKSLDKDRARRYESASQLANDVARHLAGDLVVAAPPSAGYRLRKFVKRNKGPVVAGGVVAGVLLVGIVGTAWGWSRAADESRKNRATTAIIGDALNEIVVIGTDSDMTNEPTPHPGNEEHVDTAREIASVALEATRDLQQEREEAQWSAYTANLALAQAAMEAGNWPEARERIAVCPESKRDWVWKWLANKAESVVAEVRGQPTFTNSAWVTPDGFRIVTLVGNALRIRDAEGRSVGKAIPIDGLHYISVSSSGNRILVVARDDDRAELFRSRIYELDGTPVTDPSRPGIPGEAQVMNGDGSLYSRNTWRIAASCCIRQPARSSQSLRRVVLCTEQASAKMVKRSRGQRIVMCASGPPNSMAVSS